MLCKNNVLYKTADLDLYLQNMMSKKAYRAMVDGWAGNFRRNIMPLINEDIFAPLYSEKKSRPAEPVNVLISIMLLAELLHTSTDDIIARTSSDVSIRYAMYLDTEGLDFETCTRTLQRFIMKCVRFYIENSRDLINECFDDFTVKAKQIMGVNGKLMRIDSMMIDCNARILTRLELIYTVGSDMVLEIAGVNKKRPRPEYRKIPFRNNTVKGQLSLGDLGKSEEELPAYDKEDPVPAEAGNEDSSSEDDETAIIKAQSEKRVREIVEKNCPDLPEQLYHYILRDDHNNFIYHDQDHSSEDKMTSLLSDAAVLMRYCGDRYQDNHRYQVLARVLGEQCNLCEDGTYVKKEAGTGEMGSDICQTPYAPDATYCKKDGKHHRGDKATIVEQSNNEGQSLIVGYTYGKNNESDDAQGGRIIEHLKEKGETQGHTLAGDALFNGSHMNKALKDSGMELVNTNVTGKKTPDVHAEHKLSDDNRSVVTCAYGKVPLASKPGANDSIASKMTLGVCKSCPHYNDCYSDRQRKKFDERAAKAKEKGKDPDLLPIWFRTSPKMHLRAISNRGRNSLEFCELSNYRNGVEACVSILRNNYHADSMPPESQDNRREHFGIKATACNAGRLLTYCKGKAKLAGKAVRVILKGGIYALTTV